MIWAVGLFARVVETYGRVDIVVNNAGIAAGKPIDEMTLDYWNDVVRVHLTAVFLMSRAAVTQMKSQTPQGGRIINMGSASAKTPRPDSIAYTATKFAVQGMTHQLTVDGRRCASLLGDPPRRHVLAILDAPRPHRAQPWRRLRHGR